MHPRNFSLASFRWICLLWDILNTIWPFLENVWLYVRMSLQFCGHCISKSNAPKLRKLYIQLDLDIIWCVLDLMLLFKKSWCCSKCLISLTQWYRTKLLENVPNTNYFILIVLKFRKFFYNSKNKIIHNFLMYWANTSPKGWGK